MGESSLGGDIERVRAYLPNNREAARMGAAPCRPAAKQLSWAVGELGYPETGKRGRFGRLAEYRLGPLRV